ESPPFAPRTELAVGDSIHVERARECADLVQSREERVPKRRRRPPLHRHRAVRRPEPSPHQSPTSPPTPTSPLHSTDPTPNTPSTPPPSFATRPPASCAAPPSTTLYRLRIPPSLDTPHTTPHTPPNAPAHTRAETRRPRPLLAPRPAGPARSLRCNRSAPLPPPTRSRSHPTRSECPPAGTDTRSPATNAAHCAPSDRGKSSRATPPSIRAGPAQPTSTTAARTCAERSA